MEVRHCVFCRTHIGNDDGDGTWYDDIPDVICDDIDNPGGVHVPDMHEVPCTMETFDKLHVRIHSTYNKGA